MDYLKVSDQIVESELQGFNLVKEHSELTDVIEYLLDLLVKQYDNLGRTIVVSLIGGAASGKTTMSQELVKAAEKRSFQAGAFSTDDFLIGDRAYRREHFEGKQPLAKYDFELLNNKIRKIVTNKDNNTLIRIPNYDGVTGVAIATGEENFPNKIGPVHFLIIEGDFDPVENPDLEIYLHMNDEERLNIRIDRDSKSRDANPEEILQNFNHRQVSQQQAYTNKAIPKANIIITVKLDQLSQFFYNIYVRK